MKKVFSYLLIGLLILQTGIMQLPLAFAETNSLPADSPLEVTVNEKKEVRLTEEQREFSVVINDKITAPETTNLAKNSYKVYFSKGISYESSESPISVTKGDQEVGFDIVDDSQTVKLNFSLNPEQSTDEPLSLYVEKTDGTLTTLSNELVVQYEKNQEETEETTAESSKEEPAIKEEAAIDETVEESKEEVKEEKPKNMVRNTTPNFVAPVVDWMSPSGDLPDDMTLEQYMAQYQFPNDPADVGTGPYRSTEVNLKEKYDSGEYKPEEFALVRTSLEMYNAINKSSIKAIIIMKSFLYTNSIATAQSGRNLVIEGNNLLLDFKNYFIQFNGLNNNITLQNLNTYHKYYYGAIFVYSQSTSTQNYHNYRDYGSQTMASYVSKVKISGDFISRFDSLSYISPIDGKTTDKGMVANQQNFEAGNIEFLEGSITTLETYDATNIDLAAPGDIVLYENAKVDMIAGNKTDNIGEGGSGAGINARDISNFYMKKNSEITFTYKKPEANNNRDYAGLLYFRVAGSTFNMEDGAKLTVNKDSQRTNYLGDKAIIHFNGAGTFSMSDNSTIEMNIANMTSNENFKGIYLNGANSSFAMTSGSNININANNLRTANNVDQGLIYINGNNANFSLDNSKINATLNNALTSNSVINVRGTKANFSLTNNSEINVNATSGSDTSYNPPIYVGGQSTLSVDSGSKIKILADGFQGNMITLNAGTAANKTTFKVGADSILDVQSNGRTDAKTYDVVGVGNYADFTVARLGTFSLSANRARYLFNVGTNSTFKFSDAKRVEFGFTENPKDIAGATSALINMSGSAGKFEVDVQRVKAWTSNSALDTEAPTYDWNPMFGMVIPYNTKTVTTAKIEGSSMTDKISDEFKANFNTDSMSTGGFQRLLFEFIPDVEVTIDNQPVDNADDANSMTIKGSTNAGAYVRLSDVVTTGGYTSFPKSQNTIVSPIANEDNYTVIADALGNFSFTVDKELAPFVAGNKISAYAFLNGKSDETEAIEVLDKTAPTGKGFDQYLLVDSEVPAPEKFVRELKDSNPNTTIALAYTPETASSLPGYLAAEGVYDIHLTATDTAGNVANFSKKLYVITKTEDITAKDVTWSTKDIKEWTAEEFKANLIKELAADAYKIIDGDYTDLTEKIVYNLEDVLPAFGVYKAYLSVSEADSGITGGLTAIATVTINNVGPTHPVEPTDPESGKEPEEGLENGGTTGAEGALRLDYAPTGINFGDVPFSYKTTRYQAMQQVGDKGTALSKQWLQVSDDRADKNGWQVKTSLTQFTSEQGVLEGATLSLPKGKIYNSNSGEILNDEIVSHVVELAGDGQTKTLVEANEFEDKNVGKQITTYVWDPTQVSVEVPGGKAKIGANYQAEISWSLVTAPSY